MKPLIQLLLGFVLFVTNACTTRQIIRNAEYSDSEAAFRSGDVPQAVERFPKKEEGGFVTSIEKSWLGYWSGTNDNSDLLKQVSTLDSRRYTSITREAQYFFYNESEDGYIPAEHEIIVMHLLSAMVFMRQEKWDAARVEANRAVFFLQNYFRADQEHFDDPALRLWLAGIWAALGEWNSAQVDLRRSYDMSGNKALLPYLNGTTPPAEFAVLFSGAGPTVQWHAGDAIPSFINEVSRPPYPISFDTMPWYRRHVLRNTEIRDVITSSNYMAQYYGLNASTGAEKTLGHTIGAGVKAAGVVLATVIIVGAIAIVIAIASESNASVSGKESAEFLGYAFGAGVSLGSSMWDGGDNVTKQTTASANARKEKGLEELKIYRYVRYLPNWISVTDKFVAPPGKNIPTYLRAPSSKTKVQFLHAF